MTVVVHVSGPLFDGRAAGAVEAFLDDARRAVADQGANDVRAELGRVLRNPTGFYQSRVTTNAAAGTNVVTDGGVVYGPWLEGVGSRNQATRFKGYATFRRVTARLQDKAADIAARELAPYLARMR